MNSELHWIESSRLHSIMLTRKMVQLSFLTSACDIMTYVIILRDAFFSATKISFENMFFHSETNRRCIVSQ